MRPGWLLSAVAVVVLLSLNALVFSSNISTLLDQQKLVTRSERVLSTIESVLTTLVDAETGQRGYLLTGQASYLQPYTDARRQIAPSLAALTSLTTNDPAQQQRLPELRRLITAKLDVLQMAISLYSSGKAADALTVVRSGKGKLLMDRIRSVLHTMA